MAKIAVVGAGMMGSALCVPLADRGHDVRLIGTPLDTEIVRALRQSMSHPRLGIELPEAVRCYADTELDVAARDADAFVLGVSSAGVGWAAEVLAPLLAREARPVALLSKGIELAGETQSPRRVSPNIDESPNAKFPIGSGSTRPSPAQRGRGEAGTNGGHEALAPNGVRVLSEVFASAVGRAAPGCAPVAISGPCIAGELARRVPTLVVLSGCDPAASRCFADWFTTEYYLPRVSADARGVQLCAALKNAYAMGVALGAGLHEGGGGERGSVAMHNYEAAVFARSIVEMGAIVGALGGDVASVWGLAGSGDLAVTCNGGRTGRFGALLGRGHSASAARALMAGATLECLDVLAVLERALDAGLLGGLDRPDLPLLTHLIELALHDAPLAMPLSEFFPA